MLLNLSLPRDTRDTLFLLGVVAWLLLMQSPYIPVWCSGLGVAVLLWRGWLAWQQRALPHWPYRLGLLALAVAGTWWSHHSLIGQDAGVTLITVLLALKTLELRAQRDAMVVFYLGFFTLLTHFVYSQSLLTAIGITLGLWGLLTALVQAHKPVGSAPLWHSARLAAGMALLGSPIMLVLFLLFPRLPPLWAMPDTQATARSGLSADMEVGQVARLALDDSIAFRVIFDGPAPAQNQLYFRGPVLGQFDGQRWTATPDAPQATADVSTQGSAVRYQVTLEPSQQPWLLTLDATAQTPRIQGVGHTAHATPALQWLANRPITDLLRYTAQAHTQYQLDPNTTHTALQASLKLPTHSNPRTRAWAQTLRQQVGTPPEALIQAVLQHLRTGGYVYTLEPGLFGLHTADAFWFDKKAGFCEHMASSFVVLMRALDIPARVVTGYQGGEFNRNGGFWTVRQSDAHAWAEVWLRGQGWVRVDPTAYVAPDRAASLQRLTLPTGVWLGTLHQVNPLLLTQLRLLWDATNHRWNQWVLSHEQQRQLNWLAQLGFDDPSPSDLLSVLMGILGSMALAATTVAWWLRRHRHPWLALLQRAQQRLSQAGWPLPEHPTPRQLQQLLQQSGLNAATPDLQQWLLDLEACRYDPSSPHTLRSLRARWRQLHWPTAPVTE